MPAIGLLDSDSVTSMPGVFAGMCLGSSLAPRRARPPA
jgi:hypothetical protein